MGVLPSKDGKRLFAVVGLPRGELDRYDSKTKAIVPYLSGISAQGVAFSRDGQWVAYVSFPDGTLWRARADGSDRLQLTFPPIYAALPRWSPDGKVIAFSDLGTRGTYGIPPYRMYLVSAAGGTPQKLMPNDAHPQIDATWSPDGNSVAFSWNSGSADSAIHILDMKTQLVSTLPGSRGFFSPRWSPDGHYLAAMPNDSLSVRLYDFKTRKWSLLASLNAAYLCWSKDGRYLYFLRWPRDAAIMRVGIQDRKVETVGSLRGFQMTGYFGTWFGLAPDDTPLVLKDAGTQEVVSMDFIEP
jgi:WD40 repeat protein